jgi:hypothetical protein
MTTTSAQPIQKLFANDIHRRIEEVIKVDQTDDEVISAEIEEYVVTDAIKDHYVGILEAYREMPNKPHEGIAVWVSGFFGSGKSSFAKMLGLSIANREIAGKTASARFSERTHDKKVQVLLRAISEHIPTHAVIFDVSTDRGIRSGNQTLTEIMYGLFLQSLGYAKDLDLSELEIGLEEKNELARFEDEYRKLFKKDWNVEKGKLAFALSEASRVLHSLEPDTFPMADSWVKAMKNKADITPGKLAERAVTLMKRRKPGKSLVFVIDEVGQFVARDVQKMLDLQAVVQSFGVKGRGKHWVVVTSQEKLGELVSGLDDKKIELARLMDRFPLQVHLEPSDISEVTSRRVLAKNAAAQTVLGSLYDDQPNRLTEHTRLTAAIKLPALDRQGFIDLYPLLPYQIDLIIQVVSGLRTQDGAGKHVGGANRTIIKLAQQLLINPAVNLADQNVGTLVRLDQVYDLVEGNIGSELRAKITGIAKELEHPLAQAVAKVICLLQYVKSVHRTAENIAAALHPGVTAESQLALVKEALRELEAAHKVRRGDDGYRIPTPIEDSWETQRNAINPKPGDAHRILSSVLTEFWKPQPSHTLLDTKTFKAGLAIHGREVVSGDMMFHLHIADDAEGLGPLADELRKRSQNERRQVFWALAQSEAIDRQIVELHRSREMVARKERETKGEGALTLITDEKVRVTQHEGELKRLVKAACLGGRIHFRGNDRSPGHGANDVGKTAGEVLAAVLPDVFERFKEAAAKGPDAKKGVDALFTAENLQGLPSVFSQLGLLRDEKGKPVFNVESGPLKEILDRIVERFNYGETPSGKFLADELAKEPFGWDFESVRLLVLSLLRAGRIEATSKGSTIDTLSTSEAKETFNNNNHFKAASFRPKRTIDFGVLAAAGQAFSETFGKEVHELNPGAIAQALRAEVARHEDTVSSVVGTLAAHRLPGGQLLEKAVGEMKGILRGSDENAISTFSASHKTIKDAIKRATELEQGLTKPRLEDLRRSRRVLAEAWPFLKQESDLSKALEAKAASLADLLEQETFYKQLPAIEQHATALGAEYDKRFDEAMDARIAAYEKAFDKLVKTPGWSELDEDRQRVIAKPIEAGKTREEARVPIAQLRSEKDACVGRLHAAVAEVRRILDGERVASVSLGSFFGAGIETEEQLDAALSGVREECARLIGAGKKVIVQ